MAPFPERLLAEEKETACVGQHSQPSPATWLQQRGGTLRDDAFVSSTGLCVSTAVSLTEQRPVSFGPRRRAHRCWGLQHVPPSWGRWATRAQSGPPPAALPSLLLRDCLLSCCSNHEQDAELQAGACLPVLGGLDSSLFCCAGSWGVVVGGGTKPALRQ